MTDVIERLMQATVDLTKSAIPATVRTDMGDERPVVASALLVPRKGGEILAYLVVYYRGDDSLVAPDDKHWAVGVLYDNFNLTMRYLAHGDYDLTFAEAMAVFVKRIERQG